jgi:hypothetical protein
MSDITKEKERGTLLTIWLFLMLISNAACALIYFLIVSGLITTESAMPFWVFYVFGIACSLNVIFTIFLFKWKKWAFFAFCGMAAIAFVINIAIGINIILAFCGLLGPLILYLLLKPKWELLE